jgi:hypothetical protein
LQGLADFVMHAAAEMSELREAVKELRGAIDMLAANVDPAQDKVVRLNVREARKSAALRLQQLSPATMASLVRPASGTVRAKRRHFISVSERRMGAKPRGSVSV